MDRRELLTAGVAAALVAASATPARAQDSPGLPLVGSWFASVTATNPPLGQFNDLISFHPGGIVTESHRYFFIAPPPFGSTLQTSGHGAWAQTGANTIDVFFRIILQHADTGAPIGTDNVRLALTLDHVTNTLTGTFESQIKDTANNVLLTVTGDYSATPITVF